MDLLSSLSKRTSKTSLPPVAEDVRHFVTLLCPYSIPSSSLPLFILSYPIPPSFSSLASYNPPSSIPSLPHTSSSLPPFSTSLNLSCCLYPSLYSSTPSFNLLPVLPPPFFPHSPSLSPLTPPPPPHHS